MTAAVGSDVRSVSAIFPCYNAEPTIGGLVDDVHAALTPLVCEIEVIVVNDGSRDGSRELLDALAADRPWLRPIHHERNGGYGAALITGGVLSMTKRSLSRELCRASPGGLAEASVAVTRRT